MLATITGASKGIYQLSFINAATGERVDLPIADVRGYFWTPDGRQFGLLAEGARTVYLVSLADGQVTPYPVDERVTRFIYTDFPYAPPEPLVASTSSPEDSAFVLLYRHQQHGSPYYPHDFSADGRYVAQGVWEGEEWLITVEDVRTGQATVLTKSEEGLYDLRYAWSPVDNRLAVLQAPEPPRPFLLGADRITVYDAIDGTAVATYPGAYEYIEWSPDGSQLLYVERLGEYTVSTSPCLLNLERGESACLSGIGERCDWPHTYAVLFGWSPDGRQIAYAYCTPDHGSLCLYDLSSGDVSCPTDAIADLAGRFVRAYDLSPDGRFVAFLHDIMCPSDDWGRPASAVIGLDGKGYYSLGGELYAQEQIGSWVSTIRFPYHGVLWRPVPRP